MLNRKFARKVLGILMAGCMVLGAVPLSNSVQAYADEQNGVSGNTQNPLSTKWNETEIGSHDGKGSFNYDKATGNVNVTGAGSKFDKDKAQDDLYYAFFNAKGDISITTKITLSGAYESGQVGILARNDNEVNSVSAALYADCSKKQIRYGYHTVTSGGASQVNADVPVSSDTIYLKLEVKEDQATYHVASTADFSNEKVKVQSIAGLDAKEIGFFATAGITAEFSDIKITSKNTEDGIVTNKVVFDSSIGEMLPVFTNSATYGGTYTNATKFTSFADGNILKVTATADESDKGSIRTNKNIDYMLFPETTQNYTISAEVSLSQISKSTDKVGIFVGQFAFDKSAVKFGTLQISKTMAAYPHYVNSSETAATSGDPKAANLELGKTYIMEYTKMPDGPVVTFKDASGNILAKTEEVQAWSNYSAALQLGSKVAYGLAFAGVTADVSNVTITDTDGYVVYDQNDYYIAKGVAPVVSSIDKTAVSAARDSIDLEWTASAGEGNTSFVVLVSKNGAEYTTAGVSKTNTFSYKPDGDGEYKFKVYGKAGDQNSLDAAKESVAVSFVTPLKQPVLTATGNDGVVALSWLPVDKATSYELFRSTTVDGTFSSVKTFTANEQSFEDKTVINEQPYYYYIVATDGATANTSNPSEIQQSLPTAGHTGTYVYEDAAAKFTITSKSNDTVFANKASIAGKVDRAGTLRLEVNGQGISTKEVKENGTFAFNIDLTKVRNDVNLYLTDTQGNTTRKTFNFVHPASYGILVDAAFTGENGSLVNGVPCYATVSAAVASVPADNAKAITIFIKNGEYNERVVVTSPYISLLGEDSVGTHIYYSAAIADKTATSMWDRNCMYVDSTATGFTAENLTIENSYPYKNGTDEQADALCIVADQTICVNVRLVSYQDTLLTDSRLKDDTGNYAVTRQYFEKCYITGNVDFIYGAGTSVFNDCDIVARYTEYKSDGCFSAARTYATTAVGYVFNNCRFMAEEGCAAGSYRMARPWGADASETFINCYLGSVIAGTGYGDMSGNSYKNARFAEFGTYGPAFAVNNDRPLLSADQAKAFAAATVFSDFSYNKAMNTLYAAQTENPTDPAENPTNPAENPTDPTKNGEESTKSAEESTQSGTTQATSAEESTTAIATSSNSPETGDTTNAVLYMMIICMAAGSIAIMKSKKKKRT